MLRFRSHLSAVRAASPLPAASCLPLHRLFLCTTTPASQFDVVDYLTTSCGLTPAKARNASRYLTRLKSSANPDAVRVFFAGIGVSKADLASAIARDPRFLCSNVDKTLTPRTTHLRDVVGLSPPQISRLISIAPTVLVFSRLYLLTANLERVVKPNMVLLRHCGLTNSEISSLVLLSPRMFTSELGRVKEIVMCADMLGVPRDSAMFKHALSAVHNTSPGKINTRLDFLKKALGCSEAELGIAVRKLPNVLSFSEGRMIRVVDFLKMEVGLEPKYIVRRPALLSYSLPRRLMPRHYVLKALKAKGLFEKDVDFFGVVTKAEKIFIKRFLDPYKDSAPGLADAYSAACASQVPPVISQT